MLCYLLDIVFVDVGLLLFVCANRLSLIMCVVIVIVSISMIVMLIIITSLFVDFIIFAVYIPPLPADALGEHRDQEARVVVVADL